MRSSIKYINPIKKPPDLYRSPHAQLPEIKGVRDSPKTEKQEDHVGNQIKKQDNKAFVQRNEKSDQSGTVGQTNDSGFERKEQRP